MVIGSAGPGIVVDRLVVVRGGRTVLEDITVEIPAGRLVGLLGPSGSGKSTLIRAVVGVQVVASGLVTVLGEAAGSPALRRAVGYVTQSPSVYDDLTVADNVRYFAAVIGASHQDAERALDLVGLTDHTDSLARNLSGGERTRASLACALAGNPEVLVLDEPTVGLDPVLRRDLWTLFRQLADEGRCVLISSHVMDEASRCERLLLLHQGRLLADTTPDDLLRRTGAADPDGAFLNLIDATERGQGSRPLTPPPQPGFTGRHEAAP